MDLKQLNELLKTTGLPVAYHHFSTAPSLPFIVYHETNTDNFAADDKVYYSIPNVDIEFYSEHRDFFNEKKIELYLNKNNIVWEKTFDYIEEEKMYKTLYEITLEGE